METHGRSLIRRYMIGDVNCERRKRKCELCFLPARRGRLTDRGLVELVVTKSTVHDQIDDHVFAELALVRERELETTSNVVDAISVDMEDRSRDRFSEIRRVERSSSLNSWRGVAELIAAQLRLVSL